MKEKDQLVVRKRTRKEVWEMLRRKPAVWQDFQMFPMEYQEALIRFCMGEKGLRTTYDKVFKYIYDPERHQDRLEDMIVAILGEPVRIVKVLQREGVQLKEQGIFVMETSSETFLADHTHYIHSGRMAYDTGIRLNDLFENIYISLDTYKNFVHTKIKSKKEAWMLFLASDRIEDIMEVCEAYPEFIPIYQEVFEFSDQVEELVMMFSDALRQMDRNEERYMVEELRMEREALEKEKDKLSRENRDLLRENRQLKRKLAELAESD